MRVVNATLSSQSSDKAACALAERYPQVIRVFWKNAPSLWDFKKLVKLLTGDVGANPQLSAEESSPHRLQWYRNGKYIFTVSLRHDSKLPLAALKQATAPCLLSQFDSHEYPNIGHAAIKHTWQAATRSSQRVKISPAPFLDPFRSHQRTEMFLLLLRPLFFV